MEVVNSDNNGEVGRESDVGYEWIDLDALSEADKKGLARLASEKQPQFTPEAILRLTGHIYEQRIVGLCVNSALLKIQQNIPLVFGVEQPSFAVGTFRFVGLKDGAESTSHIFTRHRDATEEQFVEGRDMWLNSISDHLREIGRNPLPPLPTRPTPSKA